MGKKRARKTYSSKGERRSIANGVKEAARSVSEVDKALNKLKAWRAGKNPWITVLNNNDRNTTNQKYIRVRANAYYGNPKDAFANIFKG